MNRAEFVYQKFLQYGTDKATHLYAPIYAKVDPEIKSLLEIGVCFGCSLLAWREIFPQAHITGIDLFVDSIKQEAKQDPMITIYQGDITTFSFPPDSRYDVIVDDGSHHLDHQIAALKNLYFNHLNSGGLYFIEDLTLEWMLALKEEMSKIIDMNLVSIDDCSGDAYSRIMTIVKP